MAPGPCARLLLLPPLPPTSGTRDSGLRMPAVLALPSEEATLRASASSCSLAWCSCPSRSEEARLDSRCSAFEYTRLRRDEGLVASALSCPLRGVGTLGRRSGILPRAGSLAAGGSTCGTGPIV